MTITRGQGRFLLLSHCISQKEIALLYHGFPKAYGQPMYNYFIFKNKNSLVSRPEFTVIHLNKPLVASIGRRGCCVFLQYTYNKLLILKTLNNEHKMGHNLNLESYR